MPMAKWPALLRVLGCLYGVAMMAACVEGQGGVRLTSFAIEGTHAIAAKEIRAVLVTQPGGRWPWSQKKQVQQQVRIWDSASKELAPLSNLPAACTGKQEE